MDAPSPRYLLTRAAFFITLVVVALYAMSFIKKEQRKNAIYTELQSLTSDSSFFQQFSAEDARKSLVRTIGLVAEATTLGVNPETAINRGMGIKPKAFEFDAERDEPPLRETIIRRCLRDNYENFLKLGYTPDFHTLAALKNGELPPIPSGPQSGRIPEIVTLIPPSISPGMEKVLANLTIRPPRADDEKPTDIEVAAAKQLVRDLANARIIDDAASGRILEALTAPEP